MALQVHVAHRPLRQGTFAVSIEDEFVFAPNTPFLVTKRTICFNVEGAPVSGVHVISLAEVEDVDEIQY